MHKEKLENYFEAFNNDKLNEMIIRAWKISDAEAQKKYGKKIKKIGVEESQKIAEIVLEEFKVKKGEPTRLEYRADIVEALTAGNRIETETDEEKTPWQEIGYS